MHHMSGYIWALTGNGELLVVLMVDGKGFVPGVENAIDMTEIKALEPVKWPAQVTQQNRSSAPLSPGALVPGATPASVTQLFAVNG